MSWTECDQRYMKLALQLAAQGRGWVEPNPLVGCVLVAGDGVVGEGYHRRFGGAHAEIEALQAAGSAARGATMYVTLEPCCHHGKTPPCTDAILAAGIRRVVVAVSDPFPQVAGGGLRQLQEAGVDVSVGLLSESARELNAPYWKLIGTGLPWVIAKWAMSWDGRIATHTGDSQWISNETSRAVVHRMRGQVDAILVGRRTVELDDPRLTARPTGARTATRIVVAGRAAVSSESQLVRTVSAAPVMVVAGLSAPVAECQRLEAAGCEVLIVPGANWQERLPALLAELGKRRMTHVLVEGGATTLGGFYDAGLLDEVHLFLGPKLIGGQHAPGPVGGSGVPKLAEAPLLESLSVEVLEGDLHLSGRLRKITQPGAAQNSRFPHPPTN